MIDTFALALSHGLILLAIWRLVNRDDLDGEAADAAPAAAEGEQPRSHRRARPRA